MQNKVESNLGILKEKLAGNTLLSGLDTQTETLCKLISNLTSIFVCILYILHAILLSMPTNQMKVCIKRLHKKLFCRFEARIS